MRRFNDRSAETDLDFDALVVSVCSATVSTLRRTAPSYASMITVEKCWNIITSFEQLRGPLPPTLTRCQWKYNMAASTVQERGLDDEVPQILMGEAGVIVSRLIHYNLSSLSLRDQELSKRLFWLLFAGQWSLNVPPS